MLEQALPFASYFKTKAAVVVQAPGRINIMGEHVDYSGGLSLPAGVNRTTTCVLAPREDSRIDIVSHNLGQRFEIQVGELSKPLYTPHIWRRFFLGCLQLFDRKVGLKGGFNIMVNGNIPLGKGMSSSASLSLSLLNALNLYHGQPLDDHQVCFMSQQVEHQYLGLQSGILDQFSVQFSKPRQLNLVDFRGPSTRPISINSRAYEFRWVIYDPGVPRQLASSGYQQRVWECRQGLIQVQRKFPEVCHLRELNLSQLEEAFVGNQFTLYKRLRFFIEENQRTLLAAEFLSNGKMEQLAGLLNQCHQGLDQLYQVSLPELNSAWEYMLERPGVLGGRLMGGGFGGCLLFLVNRHFTPVKGVSVLDYDYLKVF